MFVYRFNYCLQICDLFIYIFDR